MPVQILSRARCLMLEPLARHLNTSFAIMCLPHLRLQLFAWTVLLILRRSPGGEMSSTVMSSHRLSRVINETLTRHLNIVVTTARTARLSHLQLQLLTRILRLLWHDNPVPRGWSHRKRRVPVHDAR